MKSNIGQFDKWKKSLIRLGMIISASSLSMLMGTSAEALELVTSRSTLNGDDFIDWGQLGDPISSVSNPFEVVSNGGIEVDGSIFGGEISRRVQGQSSGWNGNFAPGDNILVFANNSDRSLTLSFEESVLGAGLQIQSGVFRNFTSSVQAFDNVGNSLGIFTLSGNSNSAADNSALFIGVANDTSNIASIRFAIDTSSFAVNQLDIRTFDAPITPIPTPALLPGLIGMGVAALRKRKQEGAHQAVRGGMNVWMSALRERGHQSGD